MRSSLDHRGIVARSPCERRRIDAKSSRDHRGMRTSCIWYKNTPSNFEQNIKFSIFLNLSILYSYLVLIFFYLLFSKSNSSHYSSIITQKLQEFIGLMFSVSQSTLLSIVSRCTFGYQFWI